jgi:hypothetical protein
MGWMARAGAVAAVAAGGVAVGRVIADRAAHRPGVVGRITGLGRLAGRGSGIGSGGGEHPEWLVATVYRAPTEVTPDGRLPEPLRFLGDAVEVRITPAPGDRGTELAVRPRPGAATDRFDGRDPIRATRLALRQTKMLLETGEILGPSRPPTSRRTLLNRPLEYATRHAREEGRL